MPTRAPKQLASNFIMIHMPKQHSLSRNVYAAMKNVPCRSFSGPFRMTSVEFPAMATRLTLTQAFPNGSLPWLIDGPPFLGCSSVDVWQAQQHERRKTFGHENVVKVHRCTVIKMFSNKKLYRRTKAKSSKNGREIYFFYWVEHIFCLHWRSTRVMHQPLRVADLGMTDY